MPIWCEPGEKKKERGNKKSFATSFTFIIVLNSRKEFESKSCILVLYEQWSVSKIDDVVKLDGDFFFLGYITPKDANVRR